MIQKAATLELTPEDFGATVRVINETGHKLPSGYPEGRRVWLHVEAFDALGQTVYESGGYDFSTAELTHDGDLKIYEILPGISPGLATALGQPAGHSFHFVLSDTVFFDNRIPPRGSTNADLIDVQSPIVAHTYADGQYWDDTEYHLPDTADSVHVELYYQTTSKEYIEFLRDANTTNSSGQDLFDAWVAQGKAPPVMIAEGTVGVDVTTGVSDGIHYVNSLSQNFPNPFNPVTTLRFSLAEKGRVSVTVYDVDGRRVRVLVDEEREAGPHGLTWDGKNDAGQGLASGVYFVRYRAGTVSFWRKAALLR
ncbi:MAG: FlgD immunoglobulin-like domain containing protein [Candidatus Eisenbacteria bacterium]